MFQLDSFFVGGNVRKVTQSGYADYIPIFLSETQRLYRCGAVPCNVAMIQVSTPDKHGFVSLGTSVDATLAAVETAEQIGRFGCFGFMIFNIPGTWFGWWSDEAFTLYLMVDAILAALYCLIWIL